MPKIAMPQHSVENGFECITQTKLSPTVYTPKLTTAPDPSRTFRRFLSAWFVLPMFFYVAAFLLIRTQSYEHWSPSRWGPLLDYAFHVGPQNADVVVFGDSSAFIGIDPRLVHKQLGLRTIVLPGTGGSLPVVNDLALEHYLATNRPPHLLVLYLSAWNLDYQHMENPHRFEGEEMLFRNASWSTISSFARRHPLEVLLFPLRLYSTFDPAMIADAVRGVDHEREVAQALGHHDDNDPFPAIKTPCTLPKKLVAPTSEESVTVLVKKYSPRMQVMVYLAAVPDCENVQALLTRSYAEVGAAPPATLPAADFVSDPNFSHVRPAFVPTVTRLFTSAVAQRLLDQEASVTPSRFAAKR